MPTSVPTWSTHAPPIDRTGRRYALLAIGTGSLPVVTAWELDLAALGVPQRRHDVPGAGADGAAAAWAAEQARAARVGWRFAVAGPEDEVLQACAAVRAEGALDAEITAHATSVERRRVCCSHCWTTTATEAAVSGTTPCTGCGRLLLVYGHVSRRWGGYLGFQVDAEELP